MRTLKWSIGLSLLVWAQEPLPIVERRLAEMGRFILEHENTAAKDSVNALFLALWKTTLQRPEAFTYPFDSVQTVSILTPPDSTFRIFTWQVIDFATRVHRYYGLLVRRWRKTKRDTFQYYVYELREIPEVLEEEDIERRTTGPEAWVGALYYHPRYTTHGVLRYEGVAYIPRGLRIQKEKLTYYVLLGWNGYNARRNFKVVETLFFDPDRPEGVFFGAPVIYAGPVPKMRVILEYSETTPLSLNLGWYVRRYGARKRYPAIIFDHVARSRRFRGVYDDPWPSQGADGTYDAIEFWKRGLFEGRKGILVYRRNVIPYAPEIESYDPKVVLRQRLETERKRLRYGLVH
ncbi:MAG: hypothetical protein NZ958_08000 [Bacteroidia bacterium]|nr:hypothetical protein [Bacteroidia bacterium]MDW8088577.1 hypothetical protein [Bacteroidia bacterium]